MKQPVNTETEQDNGWKEMLDNFIEFFLVFFFPEVHADIDWTRGYKFLDTELAKLGREHAAGKRLADKLVKVWLRDERETWLLIHIEVQGEPEKLFNRRTYTYNYRIFDRYDCEVVSLVVITGESGKQVGHYERGRWGCHDRFTFPVARVTDYRGREVELLADPNPFALAVMVQLKWLAAKSDMRKRMDEKRELIRGLLRGGRDRKFVIGLLRFIDWVMVLLPELEQQLEDELAEERKQMPFITSWERRGFERGMQAGLLKGEQKGKQKGKQEGKQEGKRELVLHQLTRKIGAFDAALQARLEQLSQAKWEQLGDALLDFASPQDLEQWLRRHTRARKRTSRSKGQ